MIDAEQKQILEEIKLVLKSKKVTYKQLSEGTGISESTLKKVFSGHDCSFSKVIQICHYLGVKLTDITTQLENRRETKKFSLSLSQEEFFCSNLLYYLFFNKIFRDNLSISGACSFFKIDDVKSWKILKKLEEFKLLEVHSGDKIKFLVEGGLQFQKEGPLQELILDKLSHALVDNFIHAPMQNEPVDSPFLRMNFGKLTSNSFEEFCKELKEVDNKYRQIATKERKFADSSALLHVSWLFGISNCNGFDLIRTS